MTPRSTSSPTARARRSCSSTAPAPRAGEHISDLAFHYLDLLDALALPRVHLVGASFGGWIAAEIAVMAPHRLSSLVLIDPVGIKVEGWISTS